MNKLTSTITSIILAVVLLSSCGEIKEEITVNADGSGSYGVSADMIPMMRTMMYSFAKMSAEEGMDSMDIMDQVEEQLWKDFPEEIDSVLSIDQRLDDDIRNDPTKMALIEKSTMFMRGGKSKGYMITGLEFEFTDDEEFSKFMAVVQEGQQKDKQAGMLGETSQELKITPKSFYRKSTQIKELDDSKFPASTSAMLDEMNIYTVLKFEKKIKSIDVKGYDIVEKSDNEVKLKFDFTKRVNKGDYSEIKIQLK